MTFIHRQPITGFMAGFDTDQRQWLKDILDRMGLTATELARRAGLDPSTLSRFLQGERDGHMLSARTIRKIEAAVGAAGIKPGMSLREEDAAPYDVDAAPPSPFRTALVALKSGRAGVDAWVVSTDDLEGIRVFDGDVLMVDLNADPVAGDIVCVQIYDWQVGKARTTFRLYEPPYLISGALAGPARKPEVLDGRNVVIRGVVIARLSPRNTLHLTN